MTRTRQAGDIDDTFFRHIVSGMRNGVLAITADGRLALINDEEATLKTYRREGNMVRLDPANRSYSPQRYREDQVRIQGKLAGLIRRY